MGALYAPSRSGRPGFRWRASLVSFASALAGALPRPVWADRVCRGAQLGREGLDSRARRGIRTYRTAKAIARYRIEHDHWFHPEALSGAKGPRHAPVERPCRRRDRRRGGVADLIWSSDNGPNRPNNEHQRRQRAILT